MREAGHNPGRMGEDDMKELDKKLIDVADFNSAVGMGSIINRTYQSNAATVSEYDLTADEKATAIEALYEMSTAELQTYSREYPSISTIGPARYNVQKGLKALDKKTEAAQKARSYMNQLALDQSKKRRAAAQQRLIDAFHGALQAKQKEFTCDGVEYVVRGRTRFIEKKYAC